MRIRYILLVGLLLINSAFGFVTVYQNDVLLDLAEADRVTLTSLSATAQATVDSQSLILASQAVVLRYLEKLAILQHITPVQEELIEQLQQSMLELSRECLESPDEDLQCKGCIETTRRSQEQACRKGESL